MVIILNLIYNMNVMSVYEVYEYAHGIAASKCLYVLLF
jgi:hypothetical protein